MEKIVKIIDVLGTIGLITMIIFRVLIWLHITPQEVLQWLS